MTQAADEAALVEQCRALHAEGLTFNRIWSEVLSCHPLAQGRLACPALGQFVYVPLASGRALEFDKMSGEWTLRGPLTPL
jgi:hypothetical protein